MAPKLILIGGETSGKYDCSVAVLNTHKWSEGPPMTLSIGYFGAALVEITIDKKIYVCGGCNHDLTSSAMEAFNLSTNRWEKRSDMPNQLDSMGVAALNGFIYVSGGRDTSKDAVSTLYRYRIRTDRWDQVTPMTEAKYGHHLVELNDYLYAVGGYDTKDVDRYDPQTDTWTVLKDTIFEHQFPGVTTYDGKIYVHGAEGFEVYTPETNPWASLTPAHNHFACSLITVGDKIWSIGGNNGKGTMKSVFEYDPVKQRWSPLPDLETPRQGHVSFLVEC